jgi:hypothetical protein
MLQPLKRLGKQLRFRSLERGDMTAATERPVENADALSARRSSAPDASGDHLPGGVPPGYIKTYDEGRPRH